MASVQTQVEELPGNRVRLQVEVPPADLHHAIEHAASDMAASVKIPGFRKGKVPLKVLLARVGRERLYAEAVESHIGGWFWNAAARSRIRPVAQPEYDYDLPTDGDEFRFTATVPVQPKPEPADWTTLEVPYEEPEIPDGLVEHELDVLRGTVAELVPVEDRPVVDGDTVVIDVVAPDEEAQRDYVVELGQGRLHDQIEQALIGMRAGETATVDTELPDGTKPLEVTVKEIKEKSLPPLDDELARSASEFETLAELREEIESRLRSALADEAEAAFRAAAVDALVDATGVDAAGPLVEARATELLAALGRSLERRGISFQTYLQLAGTTVDEVRANVRAEATQSVARELVLEAVADKLGIEVPEGEVEALVREEAAAADEDPDELLQALRHSDRFERIREDLRLRAALDRVASEVERIAPELASAREKLWTPEKEKPQTETKLWTPGSKETA